MGLQLQISLGDIVVAASTAGSIFLAYQAIKGRMDDFAKHQTYAIRKLREHAQMHLLHLQKIARIEGKVFGRRVDDGMFDLGPTEVDPTEET